MSKWDKESFIKDLRKSCSREVAKISERIIDFSEKYADEITWGRGNDHGTHTFRCNSDFGVLPIFHITSDGKINLQINFLRTKKIPPQVIRDMVVKLEANFLRDYDEEMYPNDVFEDIEMLFNTSTQVDKFLKTIEGCVYRLKQ